MGFIYNYTIFWRFVCSKNCISIKSNAFELYSWR